MTPDKIPLPTPIWIKGQPFFKRSQIEHWKEKIVAAALGGEEPIYERPQVENFVSGSQLAKEMGVSRRTLTRRMRQNSSSEIQSLVS
jgi:hypothetical protein